MQFQDFELAFGELDEETNAFNEENSRLRDEIKMLKKQNDALRQKVEEMESANEKQGETIRTLESSYDKLQKELARVKQDKDQLRVEIEEKTSKFSTENKILAEKLQKLTNDFEAVEKENNELKRRLEQLTNSNNSLKQTVDLMKKENTGLKDEMGNLKADHENLKANHESLRADYEKSKGKEARLALGQVAYLLEAEIAKVVLPKVYMGKTGVLKSMKHWLKDNSSKGKGKEAQERWEALQVKLEWKEDKHKMALSLLKGIRIKDAHPEPVNLKEARKQLREGGYIGDLYKKSCEEIIEMLVTLKNDSKDLK